MTDNDKAAVKVLAACGMVLAAALGMVAHASRAPTRDTASRQATRLCVPMPVADFYDCEYRARLMLEAGYTEKQVWADLYDAESMPEEVTL